MEDVQGRGGSVDLRERLFGLPLRRLVWRHGTGRVVFDEPPAPTGSAVHAGAAHVQEHARSGRDRRTVSSLRSLDVHAPQPFDVAAIGLDYRRQVNDRVRAIDGVANGVGVFQVSVECLHAIGQAVGRRDGVEATNHAWRGTFRQRR